MKYVVLIMDGAAGLPLAEYGGKTSLEVARTPELDALVAAGSLGLTRNVPPGMEPGSAVACMSVIGYNPETYYKGRASIEAESMGISIGPGEVVFRCNLVTVENGIMRDYSAGHITSAEATEIIKTVDREIGSSAAHFFPGVAYRHILKLRGHEVSLEAVCTPPHDISGRPIEGYLPQGKGSDILLELMKRSEDVLRDHPVNVARQKRGQLAATTIWLFWGSGPAPEMPSFAHEYGLKAAMTSGVDLLKGLAKMSDMKLLDIKGVTDGPDNDNAAQVSGALDALKDNDLVVIHIEAPDEAGHEGDAKGKIEAIEKIDVEVIGRLKDYTDDLRVLILPDHPTPVSVRTHTPEPVPFLLWGKGISANGAVRFTEAEAKSTGVYIEDGYKIMGELVGKRT